MTSLLLSLIATCWTLSLIYGIRHVIIPYIAQRIETARWEKLHPDMPSWRRGP